VSTVGVAPRGDARGSAPGARLPEAGRRLAKSVVADQAVSDRVAARPAICQTVDLERGTRCPGDARRDRASPASESPRAASQPGTSSRWIFAAQPDSGRVRSPTQTPVAPWPAGGRLSRTCQGYREDMRDPGLPKVAIFGVTSRDQLPSAKQLRSHPPIV
jgi:hypothetical protein